MIIDKHILIFLYLGSHQSRKKSVIIMTHTFFTGGGRWGVIMTLFILCLEWPNSSRNAKKNFSFVRGGVSQHPSEDQFRQNILSILTFSRGKYNFDQSCSLWCQKLKKNRLWIVTLVGGEGVASAPFWGPILWKYSYFDFFKGKK